MILIIALIAMFHFEISLLLFHFLLSRTIHISNKKVKKIKKIFL